MNNNYQQIDIVRKFVSEVKKNGIPVSDAYLFGSYAKGNPKEWSDLDVCVISPPFAKDRIDEMVKLNTIGSKVDLRIEAVPFRAEDLDDPYDTLSTEIKKYGIKIDVA
jgi:predicted nucleotidyltransferase